MGSLGFTLADRLGAKSIPCSVRGCTRTWIQMSGKGAKLGGRAGSDLSDPTSTMCDPCREKFASTVDVQRVCARPGCGATWTWSAAEQMSAFATKQAPPDRLCEADNAKLAGLTNREIPCSVEGCKRSTVFTRLGQLLAGAPDIEPVAPPTMCGPCGNVYEKLKDRAVTCGIQACKNKWTWTREEQIHDYAMGLPNEPPRRLCESCKGVFGGIANREIRCRTSGCKNTWTWARESQLNACVAGKPLPKAPHRMCQRCIDIYAATKDVERPCRRPGCKRTWTDKRGAQLARAVRGKTGDPYPHYCSECEKEVGELEDREVPCKTEHCPGTWTWSAAQQLAAGVRPVPKEEKEEKEEQEHHEPEALPRAEHSLADSPADAGGSDAPLAELAAAEPVDPHAEPHEYASAEPVEAPAHETAPTVQASAPGDAVGGDPRGKRKRRKRRREIRPPDRRCEDCLNFLKDRKTRDIACSGCGTVIHWPPESQLQTHLGNWAEPTLCGACKRDLTEAARVAEREALRHHGGNVAPGHPHGEGAAEAPASAAAEQLSAAPEAQTAPPSDPPPSAQTDA
jgi:hypothetical protein